VFPMPSSLETLIAFAIVFLLGVLWTQRSRLWRGGCDPYQRCTPVTP